MLDRKQMLKHKSFTMTEKTSKNFSEELQKLRKENVALKKALQKDGSAINKMQKTISSFEWMLKPKQTAAKDFVPEYGDLRSLNEDGLIKKSIQKGQLQAIISEYLDLLETSAAVYEKNGDYALGIFSSGWCRMMDAASRKLCNTDDNHKALASGKWLCHDSCWKEASMKSMAEGKPAEVACSGGLNLYAVPVWANKQIIGAINFGFGSPPKDDAELKKLAKKYKLPLNELRAQSSDYIDRPQFIINYAKQRIQNSAKHLGYLVERKITEDKLLEIKERYRTTLYSIGDGVITTDKDGRITNLNAAAEGYCGWTHADAVGKHMSEVFRIINAATRKVVDDPVGKVLKSEKVIGLANHTILVSKNGKEYQIADSAAPIKNQNGEVTGVVLVFSDVTEKYQAEQALVESKKRAESYLNVAAEIIVSVNRQGTITIMNDSGHKLLGYKPGELIGKNWFETCLPKEDVPKVSKLFNKLLQGETSDILSGESQVITKAHTKKTIYWYNKVLKDSNDNITGTLSSGKDISDRKLLELILDQTKERYRIISETTTDFAFSFIKEKKEYVIDWIAGAVKKITGYSVDDIKTRKCWRFMLHPDDDPLFVKHVLSLKPGEESECELRIIDPTGAVRWLSVKTICLVAEDKENYKIYGGCEDITEDKRAEKALLKTQKTVDKSPLSVFWISPEGKFAYVNETAAKKLCYSREELLSMYVWDVDPNYPREKREEQYNLYREKGELSFESEHMRSDGTMFPVKINCYYLAFEDQEIEIAEAEDITERKQAEMRLKDSEEKHRRLFETMSQGVIYQAADGSIISANPAAEHMLGLSQDQMQGKTSMDPRWKMIMEDESKVPGDDHPTMITLRTGKKVGPVARGVFIPEKGKYVWLSITATPLFRPGEDKPFQSYAVFDDITEKKHKEDQIKKQQQLINTIFENLPLGIAVNKVKPRVEFEMINNRFGEIYGVSREVLEKSDSFWDVVYEDEKFREEIKNRVLSDMESGDPAKMVWQDIPITKNGKVVKYITAQNIPLSNWAEGYVISTVMDVTARKLAEIEIANARKKAEESDRLKSAFLANMSHEIRTPMNGIMGFAELLKNQSLSVQQQQKYIEIIEMSGVRLLNIINDILDISRIEAGVMDVALEGSDTNEQLEYIYSFFKPQVEAQGMQLLLSDMLPAENSKVVTDREKVFAVLNNLVKNAIKYSRKGTIEFGCNKKGSFLEFFVKDTGIGIPKDRQDAIFDRFVQADIEDIEARQGAGLGLSISRSYVKMLGGEIWVESEEHKGSTFYFTLPYKKDIQQADSQQSNEPGKNKEDQEMKLKILIVEDDEFSAKLIKEHVQKNGKEILQAASGLEAVTISKDHPDIDLILMDIKMPDMNGMAATREIRKFNNNVVIIAQTAKALIGDKQSLLDTGFNDYITKPIHSNELKALIKKYFRK